MQTERSARMTRPIHPVPSFIREALVDNDLVKTYRSRPPYQQNDYIGWITRAKREKTKQRRLSLMIDELREGTHYMKMRWRD